MTTETIDQNEIRELLFRQLKSTDAITSALCDYHYIYGPDRSLFVASWNGHLRDAIVELVEGRDERMFRVTRVINEMLQDASEYSAYGYRDKDMVVEGIIEAGIRAYERHKRNQFKAVLAGDRNTYYGW